MNTDTIETAEQFTKHVGAETFAEAVAVTLRTKQQDEDKIAEMFATIKRIGKELADANKDKERLDWLESQTKKSPTGISFDWVPSCEGDPSGFRFMRRFFIGSPAHKLREAIDFARTQPPTT
jgi:hypothetical protein